MRFAYKRLFGHMAATSSNKAKRHQYMKAKPLREEELSVVEVKQDVFFQLI